MGGTLELDLPAVIISSPANVYIYILCIYIYLYIDTDLLVPRTGSFRYFCLYCSMCGILNIRGVAN